MLTQVVTYQILPDEAIPPDKGKLAWLVYGGDDGSVLAFKPKTGRRRHRSHWEKLRQTWRSDGRWIVKIHREQGNPLPIYVSRLVLLSFEHMPPNRGHALHRLDDPHKNQWTNLYWGNDEDNRQDQERNKARREEDRLRCRLSTIDLYVPVNWTKWIGFLESPEIKDAIRASGKEPHAIVRKLIFRMLHPNQPTQEKNRERFVPMKRKRDGLFLPQGFTIPEPSESRTWRGFKFPLRLERRIPLNSTPASE
jgi:hypothetical protein